MKKRKVKISKVLEPVPFVPAYDLYEAELKRPSPQEVAAIALALLQLLPECEESASSWRLNSKSDAISQRL